MKTLGLVALAIVLLLTPGLQPRLTAGLKVAVSIQPWCNDSIRVRMNPGKTISSVSVPAVLWTSSERQDNVLCLTLACNHSEITSGYKELFIDGYAPTPNAGLDTEPLLVWYSHKDAANFVAPANINPPDTTYTRVPFDNGGVLKAPRPGMNDHELIIFWNSQSRRSLTVSSAEGLAYAASHNFTRNATAGYLCAAAGCGINTNDTLPTIMDDIPGAMTMDCAPPSTDGWSGYIHIDPGSNNTIVSEVVSGNLKVMLGAMGSMSFENNAGTLFSMEPPAFGLNSTVAGLWSMGVGTIPASEDELVYGLGQIEGTTSHSGCPVDGKQVGLPIVRNNQTISLSISKFHVSLPWLTSSLGYGFLLNLPGSGAVTIGPKGGAQWNVDAQKQLDFWVTTTPADASGPKVALEPLYKNYVDATGHAPILPNYATLFWQSRNRYRTSAEALSVASRFQSLNISIGVFVIDFHNQRINGDFKMNPDCYPDVPQLVSGVKNKTGAELMVSLWPNIEQGSYSHDELKYEGCVAGDIVDPTTASCRTLLWQKYIKPNYFDQGVTTFWLDETDFMKPGLNCGDPDFCGRYWHNAWLQTFADGLREESVTPLILTRGWWPGAQKYGAVLWSSDIFSTFSELRAQVPEGIAAALSGVSWWATDVGGFGCPTSPYDNSDPYMQELIQRWYQFGALSPVFRTHGCRAGEAPVIPNTPAPPPQLCVTGQGPNGSCGPNEIWSFGPDVQSVLERYISLRNDVLAPYIQELARNVSERGVVTMRSLSYEFPGDQETIGINDQFLLGPKYLVAPVTEQNCTTRRMYFPAGPQWMNYWTKTVVSGGQWKIVDAPIDTLPLYVRV